MVVQELLNAHERDELDVSPWYQRRAVWTQPQKGYLINSIFAQMPVPTLYIRHTIDLEREATIKEVVDGQQRIRSILEFRAGDFSVRHPGRDRRVRYGDLTPNERQSFLMTKLPIGYLVGASDEDVIEIFGRLNAVSKTLNPQEKRSAQHSGEFHQFCLAQAAQRLPIWRQFGVFTATEISRMAEVQFVAELAMAMVNGPQDYSAKRVDDAYARWDADFPEMSELEKRFERVMRTLANIDPAVVSQTIFARSPVFYSLVLVLNSMSRLPARTRLEEAIWQIDTHFNDDRPASQRPEADLAFVAACTASTQRIRSREVRFEYIASFLQ